MFEYSEFKTKTLEGDFDKAKSFLGNSDIDTSVFNVLSNASMFLSLVFRYPEDDVYDTLNDNWDAFSDFIEDYIDGKPALYKQEEMESDYILLFEQDMEGNKIVPYISFYTEENKMLYGKSTFDIREWMNQEGFELDENITELEDHMYIVLEFISALFKRLAEPKNLEEWYQTLQNLYKVMVNYGPVITDEYAEAVAKRDDMPFYRDCAKLLAGFMRDMDNILEDILDPQED
jgi:TorA maturation chaperone TorD